MGGTGPRASEREISEALSSVAPDRVAPSSFSKSRVRHSLGRNRKEVPGDKFVKDGTEDAVIACRSQATKANVQRKNDIAGLH